MLIFSCVAIAAGGDAVAAAHTRPFSGGIGVVTKVDPLSISIQELSPTTRPATPAERTFRFVDGSRGVPAERSALRVGQNVMIGVEGDAIGFVTIMPDAKSGPRAATAP